MRERALRIWDAYGLTREAMASVAEMHPSCSRRGRGVQVIWDRLGRKFSALQRMCAHCRRSYPSRPSCSIQLIPRRRRAALW